MIVEDEGEDVEDVAGGLEFENMGLFKCTKMIQLSDQNRATFDEFIQMHQQIRHRATHEQLKEDLIEHM